MIIAVNNNKGGTLKTTISVNIACSLAFGTNRVLIVDTDTQGNVCTSFGIEADSVVETIYDCMIGTENITNCIINYNRNIDILPANDSLISIDFEVINNKDKYPDMFGLLKEVLEPVRNKYDYIIIDTPPSMNLIAGNVFTAADYILIPFELDSYNVRSLSKTLKNINDFKTKNKNLEVLGLIATKVEKRVSLHNILLQQIKKYTHENDLYFFDTCIPKTVKYASSVAFDSVPIVLSNKKDDLKEIFFDLTKEMLERM